MVWLFSPTALYVGYDPLVLLFQDSRATELFFCPTCCARIPPFLLLLPVTWKMLGHLLTQWRNPCASFTMPASCTATCTSATSYTGGRAVFPGQVYRLGHWLLLYRAGPSTVPPLGNADPVHPLPPAAALGRHSRCEHVELHPGLGGGTRHAVVSFGQRRLQAVATGGADELNWRPQRPVSVYGAHLRRHHLLQVIRERHGSGAADQGCG